jgi:hypothetical protein
VLGNFNRSEERWFHPSQQRKHLVVASSAQATGDRGSFQDVLGQAPAPHQSLDRFQAGADAMATGRALVALYDRTFLLGQSIMPAVNGLLLGYLMYRSRLVPRVLPVLGLLGAPLLIVAQAGVLFDLWGRSSSATAILALPIATWEFSLGVYLVVKGFRPSAIERLGRRRDSMWSAYEPANPATTATAG